MLTINNIIWGYKGLLTDKESTTYEKRKKILKTISIPLSILILGLIGFVSGDWTEIIAKLKWNRQNHLKFSCNLEEKIEKRVIWIKYGVPGIRQLNEINKECNLQVVLLECGKRQRKRGLVLALQGRSISEYISSRDPISGSVYVVSLAVYAAMPWRHSRWQTHV